MSNRTRGLAALVAALLAVGVPSAFAATNVTASLARVTLTSSYAPPSPDPMGVAYVPWTGHLLISDSEVEEMSNLYVGKNLFETRLDGTLVRTGTTMPWSTEPTEVAVDPATQTYFFADDDADKVFVVKDGADDLIGTGDDQVASFSTRPWNNTDLEAVAFGDGDLWLADGVTTEIYRLDPGGNRVFDGVVAPGDDQLVGSFDVGTYQTDPEGLEYWAAHGTIAVVSNLRRSPITEFAPDGAFVRSIDTYAFDIRHSSGLAVGPRSGGTGVSVYVTDRGVDNDFDPAENDGKLYELAISESTTANNPPQVVNPGAQSTDEGASVSLQIQATDPDGQTLGYTATGLPNGLKIDAATGLISGTIAVGASAKSPYPVVVGVSDGIDTSHAAFTWTVTDIVPPAAPTGLSITGSTRELSLDWADNTEPDLVGYLVSRGPNASGPWTSLTATPIPASGYRDPGAPAGGTSFYQVVAVDRSTNESTPAEGSAARSSIVFRGASKSGSKSTTLTIPRPAGTQPGDVLVASIAVRGAATVSASPQWTVVDDVPNQTALRTVSLVRVAAGETSYAFTLSSGQGAAGVIASYAGVNTGALVADHAGSANASSAIILARPISTVAPNSVLVGAFATATSATIAPPAGMVEGTESVFKSGPGKVTIEISDQVIDATGGTGARSAQASKSAMNVGLVLALNPLP